MSTSFDEALRRLSDFEPDLAAVERLRQFAVRTPDHSPRMANGWLVLTAVAATGVVAALVAFAGVNVLRSDGSNGDGGTESGTMPVVRDDPRFSECGGDSAVVIAAFSLPMTTDFHAHFPNAGVTPEVDVAAPAFVVVFRDRVDAPILGGIAGSSPRSELAMGHHDMCLWIGAVDNGQAYLLRGVNTQGMKGP